MSGGNGDCDAGGRSSSLDEVSIGQRCQSDEISEWQSCEQVENGQPSISPPYWDIDDDDDIGPKPSELYGKFTWKIENFSQISKRELRSNAFEVGGYKWYILIYPQGCDVCNHLSLFLCVANHDKLLPGWSHFAQFTIAIVNKDPKKSKYSDTLHRFWKKEHDWGWKKFMELSKVLDGFILADTLVIKAQVQVIREKTQRAFRCLDCQYRRELVRVYLSNVEQICCSYVEERRGKLSKLIQDKVRWSSFRAFWSEVDKSARRCMSSDKEESILKIVVKHFFIEKEVTSTLVMDSIYSGLKALECQSKSNKGRVSSLEMEEMPAPMVFVEKDMFFLADDVLVLLERAAMEPMPPKEDKGSQNQNTSQNRSKEGNSGEEFNKGAIERDERRLTELGRRTVEIFVLAHIFSNRIEVAYQEAVALKRQEDLIREEEVAWQAEELKGKRGSTEKEKKNKKKQAKQRRSGRKVKDRIRDEKPDLLEPQDESHRLSPSVERWSEDYLKKPAENIVGKIEVSEGMTDVSGDDGSEALQPDLEDRDASPSNWDTDTSEVLPGAETSNGEIPNEQAEKKNHSMVDDSSSTCSTDSVPSVGMSGQYRVFSSQNKGPCSPSRGKNEASKATCKRASQNPVNTDSLPSDAALDSCCSQVVIDVLRANKLESGAVLSSKDRIQFLEQNLVKKQEEVMPLQKKPGTSNQVDVDRPTKPVTSESSSSSPSSPTVPDSPSLQQSVQAREPSSNSTQHEELISTVTRSHQAQYISKPVILKAMTTAKVTSAHHIVSISRPSSVPLIPDLRPTAPFASTFQKVPTVSRSFSISGDQATQSYRNAIIGKNFIGASCVGIVPRPLISSSSQGSTYSQHTATFLSCSSTSPPQNTTISDTLSVKPGLAFHPMIPEAALSSQNRWAEGSSVQEASSSSVLLASNIVSDTARLDITDVAHHRKGVGYGASIRQLQGGTLQDFPHIDLINYLFDEEQVIGKASATSDNQNLINRQYTFPGSLGTTESNSSSDFNQFETTGQSYDDAMHRTLYGSSNGPFHGRRGPMSPHLNPSGYANDRLDGMQMNQWPSGSIDQSMQGPDVDIQGYPYQLPDYSGLTRGFNGYNVYRPAHGR